MRGRLLLLCLLASACGADDGDAPIVGQAQVAVLHYDYHFDMETRQATAALRLLVQTPGDCFVLPMRTEGLSESSIDGEAPLQATHDGTLATLCGAGWPADSEIDFRTSTTVPLETWGDSQVGYSVSEDIEGNPFSYLVSWVGGCDRFGPCDARPHTFAQYRFTIDHPADQQVLCPGTITAAETQTICEFAYEGGPTYSSFGFAASPSWKKVDLGDWGGVSVSFYDMPTADLAGKLDVDEHRDFTAWMVQNFGPYPYGAELRFAAGPTYWNGFEHPGNIVLNERLTTGGFGSSYSNPLAHTTSHEIAHQWAGDQTTLANTYDFVWKEAMAEYLVFAHKVENVSESRANRTLYAWEQFSGYSEYYLVPGEEPPLIDYYGDVYGPGPMILFRQIEALYDRESVLMALSQLLGAPRAISIDDVQSALEDTTGADLSHYFATWVHGEGAPSWPRYAVTTEAYAGGITLTVAQEDVERGLFGCAFDIAIDGTNDGEEKRVRVNLGPDGMASWSDDVDLDFELAGLRFDPDRECLGSRATADATERPYRAEFAKPWVAEASR